MAAIFKRELSSSLNTLTGCTFCVFVLLFTGIYCSALNIKSGYAHFEYVLNYMAFILIIAIPVLTMKSFSDEFRQGTAKLLYSLPISTVSIVLGKFFALCTVMLIPSAVIGLYPAVLMHYGPVPLAAAYGTLAAFFFLAAALMAIGLLISSLTENAAASAGTCFAVLLFFYYGGSLAGFAGDSIPASLLLCCSLAFLIGFICLRLSGSLKLGAAAAAPVLLISAALWISDPKAFSGLFKSLLENLGIFEAFYAFVDGVFDLPALVFLLSVTAAALFFTIHALEKRRLG